MKRLILIGIVLFSGLALFGENVVLVPRPKKMAIADASATFKRQWRLVAPGNSRPAAWLKMALVRNGLEITPKAGGQQIEFMPLTGEAGVPGSVPAVPLAYTMCHETAHRLGKGIVITAVKEIVIITVNAGHKGRKIGFLFTGYP